MYESVKDSVDAENDHLFHSSYADRLTPVSKTDEARMSRIVKLLSLSLILAITRTVLCQDYNYYSRKPGSCPPALPVQICSKSCVVDEQCQGIGKCCPTSCGGFVCSRPVTMRNPTMKEKSGSCPTVPTGRWICSPTCSTDGDCRGARKCCKNRCGALTCQKPEIEAPVYDYNTNNPNRYYAYSN
ncbi:waprin-Phi1 [Cephus cinctus]|uniref:Waprin-Phi1 n=1 Tax=Cephus cinctus TaxID=211228 RepID=A0AAJ7BMH4_CEPCN|nr:waprin-Phi1 [Cephus cinctus]